MFTTAQPARPIRGSYLMPSLEHATVADAMHPDILSCEPDAPLSEVARIMATHHVHALAVIGVSHREPECGVWGIVSDLDLVRAGIRNGSDETARSLAAHPLLSVAPALPLREAAELMISNRASHVVVIDPATWRPVGTLSTSTSPACSPGARRRDRRRLSQGCQQAG